MMPQVTQCRPIVEAVNRPEIHTISRRYGDRWERLSKLCKWTLLSVLSLEAAIYAGENLPMGEFPVLTELDLVFDVIALTTTEQGDLRYIVAELQDIDEREQALLVAALGEQIAAGVYAVEKY